MRAEGERRSGAAERSAAARLVTTRSSRILDAGGAATAILRRSASLLIGKPLAVLVEMADRPDFRSRLVLLPQGGLIQDWRFRLHAPDGGSIQVVASVESVEGPMPDGSEGGLRWSIVADDDIVSSQTEPKDSDDPLGDLVSDLIHELNQPLAAIVSYARGCVLRAQSGQLPTAVVEKAMDHIVQEATRAAGILRARGDLWRKP